MCKRRLARYQSQPRWQASALSVIMKSKLERLAGRLTYWRARDVRTIQENSSNDRMNNSNFKCLFINTYIYIVIISAQSGIASVVDVFEVILDGLVSLGVDHLVSVDS
jgi:hypothetical protein